MRSNSEIGVLVPTPKKVEKKRATKRIIGYDIARGLAVFIMVFVNFEMVIADKTSDGIYRTLLSFLHGKGAALFVVLAGAGMSLMLKSVLQSGNKIALWSKQKVLLKRATFLFVFGLLYLPLWTADILHFYGFYISIGAFMAMANNRWLWITSAILILGYPFLLEFTPYETGWNWNILEYEDFWTASGFFRNLFINGFHPVLPWVAFIFAGLWLGRQNLNNKITFRRILIIAASLFMLIQITSNLLIENATSSGFLNMEDALTLFGTEPMPPFPLYMLSGICSSYVIILLCIGFSERFRDAKWMKTLVYTGQMAFTHYVGHVIVGMLVVLLLVGENRMNITFTFWYAVAFCVASVIFSWLWRKQFQRGPMSMLMRAITG